MKHIECEQNTPEWIAARLGRITASGMEKIISPTGKKSTQVEKYITTLIGDIVSGQSEESYTNRHMERGKTLEEEAADYYAMVKKVDPKRVGSCLTDDEMMGCSPDRFIGEDGVLEIKTCISRIMIEQYEGQSFDQDHRPQTQSSLFVTGRQWIDTMLYSPGMKPLIVRSERLTTFTMDMIRLTGDAHKSMQERLKILHTKGLLSDEAQKFLKG